MDRLKNIVVGIDFSEASKVALRQAIRMARWNRARLHVVHVVQSSVVSDLQDALGDATDEFGNEVRAAALERLGRLVADSGPQDIDLETDVAIGTPFAELLRRVQDVPADLLVVGMRGSSGRRISAGTLAIKCVRKAATKVMLVHEDHAERFKSIMACVDFSDTSDRVVEQAVRVCLQDKAEMHVIHAFYPPWKILHYMAPTPQAAPDYQAQYRQSLNARLQQLLKPFEAETSRLNVQCRLVECAQTAEGVVESKQQTGADLIILGTRGRTTLKSLLIGTTAERIIQESSCSVLAIKPDGFEYNVD